MPAVVKEGIPGEKYLGKDEHGNEYTAHDVWRKKMIWKPKWQKVWKTKSVEAFKTEKVADWKIEKVQDWKIEKKQDWVTEKVNVDDHHVKKSIKLEFSYHRFKIGRSRKCKSGVMRRDLTSRLRKSLITRPTKLKLSRQRKSLNGKMNMCKSGVQ